MTGDNNKFGYQEAVVETAGDWNHRFAISVVQHALVRGPDGRRRFHVENEDIRCQHGCLTSYHLATADRIEALTQFVSVVASSEEIPYYGGVFLVERGEWPKGVVNFPNGTDLRHHEVVAWYCPHIQLGGIPVESVPPLSRPWGFTPSLRRYWVGSFDDWAAEADRRMVGTHPPRPATLTEALRLKGWI